MELINWIDFTNFGDERGSLVAVEARKQVPFDIKRVYYLYGLMPEQPRGFHAHKELTQVAVCLVGSCRMVMDDGVKKDTVTLQGADRGLLIPPMVWHEMHDFSSDCVLIVFASDHYDESDYIRDYESFSKMV